MNNFLDFVEKRGLDHERARYSKMYVLLLKKIHKITPLKENGYFGAPKILAISMYEGSFEEIGASFHGKSFYFQK